MLKQVAFPPEVLARIAPDISLQRHLSIGLRPNLRNFTEFKPLEIADGTAFKNSNPNVVGSSVIKSGSTTVMNVITLGIVDNSVQVDAQGPYSSVYPVIEILRGRSGEPTDEDMILAQSIHETILHSKIIPSGSLEIKNVGIQVTEDEKSRIIYPDLHPEEYSLVRNPSAVTHAGSKSYSFVLLSNIKIFSKSVSTSSLFDLCHLSTINALSSISLPRVYIGESDAHTASASIARSRRSNKRSLISTQSDSNLTIDTSTELQSPLKLELTDAMDVDSKGQFDHSGISSNFGLVTIPGDDENQAKTVLLADLEGEAEETSIFSRISVIANKSDRLKRISLINGDGGISLEALKKSIEIAKLRAREFEA
ncbi:uncharacterized protein CANTADRAFT_25316 [Suhomyces tanzawaensis NRRL Y-17324]|uniref:Ribosomal RNA-processing protein 43 n=1 Tax=Suhomyces tanzawaensis NRRL Y-17324 TaxID=984487 RepID=A0A1E4SNP0_9ASCO|nr:uncharacterized protein CANTADRAFT_25316 [Suhomyces tanzawaensis NRRL Y-17324]ODV81037.1 hypothetical protein CANTADRAFT_25316 [Suhomyces tanzawaensis NRRL Y-17324]